MTEAIHCNMRIFLSFYGGESDSAPRPPCSQGGDYVEVVS